jgi:hypothetical protein
MPRLYLTLFEIATSLLLESTCTAGVFNRFAKTVDLRQDPTAI